MCWVLKIQLRLLPTDPDITMALLPLREKHHTGTNIPLPSLFAMGQALLVTLVLFSITQSCVEANPLESVKACIMRQYRMYVNKTISHGGRVLTCEGNVLVKSCWGRCMTFEYGDYKIPYRVSHHPVCTYAGWETRQVVPPGCDADHPDPKATVIDATGCNCDICDTETTSCENLNW